MTRALAALLMLSTGLAGMAPADARQARDAATPSQQGDRFYCEDRKLGTWFYCERPKTPAPEQPAPVAPPPRAADLLLEGLSMRYTDGYAAAVPLLKSAVAAFGGLAIAPASPERPFARSEGGRARRAGGRP